MGVSIIVELNDRAAEIVGRVAVNAPIGIEIVASVEGNFSARCHRWRGP